MEITAWYQRVKRWGQTNLTEIDARDYPFEFWRDYWRKTQVGGVIVNAGGIIAYYPSKFGFHNRAKFLDGRDLFGEVCKSARGEGLAVLARMDSNRAGAAFYAAHPDWFCQDQKGEPVRAGDQVIACVNGPYYREYLPQILAEIIEREHPDGFADNSWSGLGRDKICYCPNCRKGFGEALPVKGDWDDAVYRKWITWSYASRMNLWDENNALVQRLGGPHCLWLGMVNADPLGAGGTFRDMREIARRSPFLLLDAQFREDGSLFARNAENGDRWHELAGQNVQIAESMAQYQGVRPTFRRSPQSPPEAKLWMQSGIAGGLLPWWHHVGASQGDKRMFETPPQVFDWHARNEEFLTAREPMATVAIVWSQKNIDFHGRELARERVMMPLRGACDALIRARIPYSLIHADDLIEKIARFSVVVLPEMAVLSDEICQILRDFVKGGGGLVASGEVAKRDENGEPRADFPLGEVFGVERAGENQGVLSGADAGWGTAGRHSYLQITAPNHPLFEGIENTDLLAFGGVSSGAIAKTAQVLATYLPPFPIYPPETAWFEAPEHPLPSLFAHEFGAGRALYFGADIERCFARDGLPDHARLIANAVHWASAGKIPLEVRGAGLLDCRLYRQDGRVVLHLVNNQQGAPPPLHELVGCGPFQIRVRFEANSARALVSNQAIETTQNGEWCELEIASILDHEVVVLEGNQP